MRYEHSFKAAISKVEEGEGAPVRFEAVAAVIGKLNDNNWGIPDDEQEVKQIIDTMKQAKIFINHNTSELPIGKILDAWREHDKIMIYAEILNDYLIAERIRRGYVDSVSIQVSWNKLACAECGEIVATKQAGKVSFQNHSHNNGLWVKDASTTEVSIVGIPAENQAKIIKTIARKILKTIKTHLTASQSAPITTSSETITEGADPSPAETAGMSEDTTEVKTEVSENTQEQKPEETMEAAQHQEVNPVVEPQPKNIPEDWYRSVLQKLEELTSKVAQLEEQIKKVEAEPASLTANATGSGVLASAEGSEPIPEWLAELRTYAMKKR